MTLVVQNPFSQPYLLVVVQSVLHLMGVALSIHLLVLANGVYVSYLMPNMEILGVMQITIIYDSIVYSFRKL